MKITSLVAVGVFLFQLSVAAAAEKGWISAFDGNDLAGWKSNDETPGVFTVADGALKVSGGRAHLFYVGADGKPISRTSSSRRRS